MASLAALSVGTKNQTQVCIHGEGFTQMRCLPSSRVLLCLSKQHPPIHTLKTEKPNLDQRPRKKRRVLLVKATLSLSSSSKPRLWNLRLCSTPPASALGKQTLTFHTPAIIPWRVYLNVCGTRKSSSMSYHFWGPGCSSLKARCLLSVLSVSGMTRI